MSREAIVLCHLGHMPFRKAWELQARVQARLIADKRAAEPEPPPHILLFVEHPHVFTLGKNGSAANVLASAQLLEARGAELIHIDRGGDVTYHGPGQLVGYPILDLDRYFTDIHRYLRSLEEVIIRTCADLGVSACRVDGRTGVWVGPDVRGVERKICAMGIRCSRWVTMHGFALNVNTDLSYFAMTNPCGIRDREATSLAVETGRPVEEAGVRRTVARYFQDVFDADIIGPLPEEASLLFLDSYARGETTLPSVRV